MITTALLFALSIQVAEPPTTYDSESNCTEAEARRIFRDWQSRDAQSSDQDELGAGPHVLIISDGQAMTRINYKSGLKCKKARDEIRRQVHGSMSSQPGVVMSNPSTKAFCVPV